MPPTISNEKVNDCSESEAFQNSRKHRRLRAMMSLYSQLASSWILIIRVAITMTSTVVTCSEHRHG